MCFPRPNFCILKSSLSLSLSLSLPPSSLCLPLSLSVQARLTQPPPPLPRDPQLHWPSVSLSSWFSVSGSLWLPACLSGRGRLLGQSFTVGVWVWCIQPYFHFFRLTHRAKIFYPGQSQVNDSTQDQAPPSKKRKVANGDLTSGTLVSSTEESSMT